VKNHSKIVDFLVVAASFVFFALIFNMERAFLLSLTTSMLFILVQEYWRIASRVWFVVFIASVFLTQSAIIFVIKLPEKFNAPALFVPFVMIEGVSLFFVIAKIDKILVERSFK
tara:strand:- start:379 stop:720 length:342 start_codon:yes stop_codon:yes gene_type:complete